MRLIWMLSVVHFIMLNSHIPSGEDLIAPCHCRGTQKYVHRSCLDNWRSTKVSDFGLKSLASMIRPIMRREHLMLALSEIIAGGFCFFTLYRMQSSLLVTGKCAT